MTIWAVEWWDPTRRGWMPLSATCMTRRGARHFARMHREMAVDLKRKYRVRRYTRVETR